MEETDCACQGRKTEFLGDWLFAQETSDNIEHYSAVKRGVLLELLESIIATGLTDTLVCVKFGRFVKNDSKSLQTVKMTFPTKARFDRELPDGVLNARLYYQPVEIMQKVIQIFRSYRC